MARDFPGTAANRLDLGDIPAIDITGTALTLSAWIKAEAVGAKLIIAKWHLAAFSACQYRLYVSALDKPSMSVSDGVAEDSVSGATTISNNVWYHLCGRKNGIGAGALEIFLNGASDGSIASNMAMVNTAAALRLGADSPDSGAFWNGWVAEAAIWNVALSNAEIFALSKGASPLLFRRPSLKAHWPLWGGSPEIDLAAEAGNLTVTGTLPRVDHAPLGPPIIGMAS